MTKFINELDYTAKTNIEEGIKSLWIGIWIMNINNFEVPKER